MANPSNAATTYTVSGSFKLPYLKEGLHVGLIPMDDVLLKLIGQVTIQWASFENWHNKLIEALLTAAKRDEPGWRTRAWRKRKVLLVQLVEQLFAANTPDAVTAFRKIAAEAAALHWKRNVVVHGTLGIVMQPHSSIATFTACGFHNGQAVEVALDVPTLEQLWHDLAHLNGALKQAALTIADLDGFWPSLPDKQLLQLFQETGRPQLPIDIVQ
jgi:hypothetical protein